MMRCFCESNFEFLHRCPICLDMLKKTMTTKECLHRFCSDCIITALRSGNKECPTCRKKLVSKRSLRPDPNFDCLISVIKSCFIQLDSTYRISFIFRKYTLAVTSMRSIRRKSLQNSTKVIHSKPW